jgi:hypothetical protein
MDIEIARPERMSQSGSSLLRLIQNDELPTLDLLVRESIQNSSDAVLEDRDYLDITFNIRKFQTERMSRHFTGIDKQLIQRYGNGENQSLVIRDKNTTGLEGPLHIEEVEGTKYGNLLTLIYEISKPQEKEGAGGSWGLGKTIYFRTGMGLVVYYTRIKLPDGSFQSRLAGCLVENEKEENTLLEPESKGPKRGIAWWGKLRSENQTAPVTDEEEVLEILNDMNVIPSKGEETGTAVVLPFVNEDELMQTARASYEGERYWWLDSLDEYLKVAVQRWYAPRIENKDYNLNKWMKVSINNRVMSRTEMLPLFKLVQDLYNASSYSGDRMPPLLVGREKINLEKIHLRNIFERSGEAGQMVFTKLKKSELKMDPPDNHSSPYAQADVIYNEGEANPPVITFVRRAGMLINYDATGSWVNNIQPTTGDEYIIGIFIPNSKNLLKKEFGSLSLEEYLRGGEKADHTSWNDYTIGDINPHIVAKIKNQSGKKINDMYNVTEQTPSEVVKTGMGRSLASILLPPEQFGKAPSTGSNKKSGTASRLTDKSRKSNLVMNEKARYIKGSTIIPFRLNLGGKVEKTTLKLMVSSETGNISETKWEDEKEIGTPFPLKITDLIIEKIETKNQTYKQNKTFEQHSTAHGHEIINPELIYTGRYNIPYGISFQKESDEALVISGEIVFEASEKSLKATISNSDEVGE